MNINKIMGNSLREFRKEQGLTIKEFAENFKISAGVMANIESGQKPIPLKMHIQIEKVYGVEFLHILNRIDFTGLTELEKGELVEYIEDIKIKQEKHKKRFQKEICRYVKDLIEQQSCNDILKLDIQKVKECISALIINEGV